MGCDEGDWGGYICICLVVLKMPINIFVPPKKEGSNHILLSAFPVFSSKNGVCDLFQCERFNEDLLLVFSSLGFATHFLEVIKESKESDMT